MQRLIRLFSFNSYYFIANGVGLVLAVAVLRDGLTTLEVVVVLGYAVGAALLARRLRTPRQQLAQFDGMAAFNQALRDPRPTMLEFYSDNCAICMTTKPVMERLEQEVGQRLQILRINVGDAMGQQLANRYDISFTPTFVLLTGAGLKDEEFTLYLDRPRVLYWLDQQTIAPPATAVPDPQR
jgi:thiol-disulfide isomerase/thioredoxin